EEERRRKTGEKGRELFGADWQRTENETKVCKALEKVAQEIGAKSITSVAIAYVMQKAPYIFPIIGGRKVEHFHSNLEALDINLTEEHIAYLESIVPFERGFPYTFFGTADGDYNGLYKNAGHFDKWPLQQAIRPVTSNAN
ncbi:hypothetical protein EIP91_010071, partial [Steccherinum ochraceum]